MKGRVEELPEYKEGPHPPLESDRESPLVKALLAAREQELGEPSEPIGLMYWTDAALFAQISGTQAVVCGPGDIAQAHTNDEWISRDQLHAAYRIYVRAATELCMQGD
jgi:acetylornithine deacetylase/succinyl-diaminopimelate desuccinylase